MNSNIQKKLKHSKKIDFTDSPFSKIISNKKHISNIINIASRKINTKLNTPIAKGINIELRTWKKFIQGKYIKSLSYDRINNFCNISINSARKGIYLIDDIRNPNLPLNFDSKEGARLDAGIINEGRMRDRIIEYTNKDKEVLNKILKYSKKLLGNNFSPNIRIDRRDSTRCISFPPIFAKHYSKLGFTKQNKSSAPIHIPQYILDNEDYQKIWWQGNLSEEASIHYLIHKNKKLKNTFYITPRIQLNRVKSVKLNLSNLNKETTYYQKDLPKSIVTSLKMNPLRLMLDEASILNTFDIQTQPYFSKLYVNKLNQTTATYTILLYKLEDIEKYITNIGFELKRHKKQTEILFNSRGRHNLGEIRDILIKFYKLTPKYLRGIKKIRFNKWLSFEDKKELLKK